MRSLVTGCLTGLLVSIAVCRFIQADAERHLDVHLRAFEQRLVREHAHPGCWRVIP